MSNNLFVMEPTDIFIDTSQYFNIPHTIKRICDNVFPPNGMLQNKDVSFFKVKMLSFDEEYPRREAIENVLFSIDNPAFNFVYILEGGNDGVSLYLGVVRNGSKNINNLSASDYGRNLKNAFEGNFNGSILETLKGDGLREIIDDVSDRFSSAGVITGVPSINDVSGKNSKEDFQGVDRLINSMLGLNWRLVVVCEPLSKEKIYDIQNSIYYIYNDLAVKSKMNLQQQINENNTESDSLSRTTGTNQSSSSNYSRSDTKGVSSAKSESYGVDNRFNSNNSTSSSRNDTYGTGETKGSSESEGKTTGSSHSNGTSTSLSFEMTNKKIQEMMSYIDDELLKRMKIGFSKGMYKSSIIYMAENPVASTRLKNAIISLFQGDGSSFSPMSAMELPEEELRRNKLLTLYQNLYENEYHLSYDVPTLYSRPYEENKIGLSTFLNACEISLIAGLPQNEVPGIILKKAVHFGLNQKNINDRESINIGLVVQKGRTLERIPFLLNRNSLSKHTFIAGVTGSGKTTTCHRLLGEFKKPYLVIEPAKTEYRTLISNDSELVVFTIGNENVAPFRINPFELTPGETISAHIDMIKATFTSAFPMEASMPQLLEEAIIKVYEDKGWDLATNINTIWGEQAFAPGINSFPRLSDLLMAMEDVVKDKHFDERLKNDYIGSLVSRLSNLTKGSKGFMLNCSHSIDFDFIAENNVILEMDDLKSPEDKALIMGFVLTKISSVIRLKHKKNKNYTHLTLVEEAHRLLSKPDYGDSGSRKSAVETFADLLAEVRKYGEGLIIVDQIPNKLAPEVLKNTNTKIIHRILAKDDKEAVGDTMLMDDKQKAYLSDLPVGQAVIFTENTDKPVNVQIMRISDTNEAEIEDDVVKIRYNEKKQFFIKNLDLEMVPMQIDSLIKKNIYSLSVGKIDYNDKSALACQITDICKQENIDVQLFIRIAVKKHFDSYYKEDRWRDKYDNIIATMTLLMTEYLKTDFDIDSISEHTFILLCTLKNSYVF